MERRWRPAARPAARSVPRTARARRSRRPAPPRAPRDVLERCDAAARDHTAPVAWNAARRPDQGPSSMPSRAISVYMTVRTPSAQRAAPANRPGRRRFGPAADARPARPARRCPPRHGPRPRPQWRRGRPPDRSAAAVPITTRAHPRSSPSRTRSTERRPPPSCTRTRPPTAATIRRTTARFSPSPNARSRSTT